MKKLVGSVVLPILGLSLLAGCAPTGGTAAVVNGVSIPDSRVTEATDGCASVMRDFGVPEGQMHLQVLRWAVFDEVARQFVATSGLQPTEAELLAERVVIVIDCTNCKVLCFWLPKILVLFWNKN